MFKLAKPLFLMCETPLHAGSGNDLGVVDLPIQRERHTDFPKIEGSSLKGGIREIFEQPNQQKTFKVGTEEIISNPEDKQYQQAIDLAFGPENAGDENYAGALGFTDARLLLFPVKSMKGVFVWITCPKILQRFANDLKLSGITPDFPLPEAQTAPQRCEVFIQDNKIVLEEYLFEIQKDSEGEGACTKFAQWLSERIFPVVEADQSDPYMYWRNKIKTDLIVLSDDDFRDFVTLATEVITRTKINPETGTVQPGALFTEEYLPAESVLYVLALATPIFQSGQEHKGIFAQSEIADAATETELVMQFFENGLPEMIQLGGNATIGKGLVRTKVMEG
jgi:CRISPR-associated protein Cmr4